MKTARPFLLVGLISIFPHATASDPTGASPPTDTPPLYAVDATWRVGPIESWLGSGVSVDGLGNVYVLTSTVVDPAAPDSESTDAYLASFTLSGEQQWASHFGTERRDSAEGLGVDPESNVYVVVNSSERWTDSVIIWSFTSTGEVRWEREIGPSWGLSAYGAAVDRHGNVYVAGSYLGNFDEAVEEGGSSFILSLSSGGDHRWTRVFGGGSTGARAYWISTNQRGDVYVVGITRGDLDGANAGELDAFVRAYSSDGEELWTRQFGGPLDDLVFGAAVDPEGNVTVVGHSQVVTDGSTLQTSEGFVRSFDVSGALRWSKHFELGQGEGFRGLWTAAADGLGNVYVGGIATRTEDAEAVHERVLRVYTRDGELLWVEEASADADVDNYIAVAAVGDGETLVLAGAKMEPQESDMYLIVKVLSRRTEE